MLISTTQVKRTWQRSRTSWAWAPSRARRTTLNSRASSTLSTLTTRQPQCWCQTLIRANTLQTSSKISRSSPSILRRRMNTRCICPSTSQCISFSRRTLRGGPPLTILTSCKPWPREPLKKRRRSQRCLLTFLIAGTTRSWRTTPKLWVHNKFCLTCPYRQQTST